MNKTTLKSTMLMALALVLFAAPKANAGTVQVDLRPDYLSQSYNDDSNVNLSGTTLRLTNSAFMLNNARIDMKGEMGADTNPLDRNVMPVDAPTADTVLLPASAGTV